MKILVVEDEQHLMRWLEPANAYITKPFHPMEVVSIVERILSSQPTLEASHDDL